MQIIAILAMDESLLIGKSNGLPWHIPEDMKRIREFTMGGVVVMGRNTYFSLPEKVRPLPNRRNIVITRTPIPRIECYSSIEDFIESMKNEKVWKVYLFGGASLYNQFFEKWLVDEVELTLLDGVHEWDIFVKEWRQDFREMKSEDFEQGKFITLEKNIW
jgi:dihydrofolate reductase